VRGAGLPKHARDWRLCHLRPGFFDIWLKRMKILKKTFAIGEGFDYISAPRRAEQPDDTR
jgi:hypothetical protein